MICFNSPFSLNIQQIPAKNSSAYWVSISEKRNSCTSFSAIIISNFYSSLPSFKSVINSRNKNILNEQKKPSPCNCQDKTSCSLKEIYQHKNLVYSCKVSTPDLKQNYPHYIRLTNHKFKDRLYKHNKEVKKKLNRTF